MFSKKNRLSSAEFSRTIKKGKGYSSPALHVKLIKNSTGYIRIGVGVSKQLATRPTKRNYYKRILKNTLFAVLPEKDTPYDVVIIARESAGDKSFEELKKDAKDLLQKTPIFSK
ncbi:MAG: ribonuclease P protein component [Candidatus Spechtbacterales bacterium]